MADKFLKTLKLPGIDKPYKIPQTAADVGAAPAGYGLGEAELISMADIDSITYPGWYYSNESATLGGYTSNRWWMQVLAYGSGTTFATQRIITFNNGVGYELIRHKINGTWGEWEWENPPMSVGVEYCTTERWSGKPVFTKLVDCGAMTNGGSFTYTDETVYPIRYAGYLNGNPLPSLFSSYENSTWKYVARVEFSKIFAYFGSSWNNPTLYVQVWYTKT